MHRDCSPPPPFDAGRDVARISIAPEPFLDDLDDDTAAPATIPCAPPLSCAPTERPPA